VWQSWNGSRAERLRLRACERNIRDKFLGKDSFKSRFMESMIGFLTPSAEAYAKGIVPLLVSPDLEGRSGAMFNQKGDAILPSPTVSDSSHVKEFMTASERLVSRVNVALRQ